MGADPDHFTQIRAVDPARRQSRRRRHRRVAGAAFRPQRPAGHLARPASDRRPGRRGAALWRRRHHAGDLGPERDRRPEGRCAVIGAGRGAADHHHPDRAFHRSEERHRLYRQDLRSGHAGLVPGDRLARHRRHRARARRARRLKSAVCLRFPDPSGFPRQLRHSRRRLSRGNRRRSDVCRHGPFRPGADPARMVRGGASRPRSQLFRTGGIADHGCQRDRQSILSTGAGLDALRACRFRDGGDRDRFAGDHLRGVFTDAAIDPARLPAADADQAHPFKRHRPDLCAAGELVAGGGHARRRRSASAPRMPWRALTALRCRC